MMEKGRGLSRCTRIRRIRATQRALLRRLIKSPPSSLAFSEFLHFSFRHCLARSLIFLSIRFCLPILSFAFSRHPLLITSSFCICKVYRCAAIFVLLLLILFITLPPQDGIYWTPYQIFYSVNPSVCWKPLVTLRFIIYL